MTGFDEIEFCALAQPPLITVRIDAKSFGRIAARRALGLDTHDVAVTAVRSSFAARRDRGGDRPTDQSTTSSFVSWLRLQPATGLILLR